MEKYDKYVNFTNPPKETEMVLAIRFKEWCDRNEAMLRKKNPNITSIELYYMWKKHTAI